VGLPFFNNYQILLLDFAVSICDFGQDRAEAFKEQHLNGPPAI
jgi:hypothetical protein